MGIRCPKLETSSRTLILEPRTLNPETLKNLEPYSYTQDVVEAFMYPKTIGLPEIRNSRFETRNMKPEIRSPESGARSPEPLNLKTRSLKPAFTFLHAGCGGSVHVPDENPKPETRDSEPGARTPEPQTPEPENATQHSCTQDVVGAFMYPKTMGPHV